MGRSPTRSRSSKHSSSSYKRSHRQRSRSRSIERDARSSSSSQKYSSRKNRRSRSRTPTKYGSSKSSSKYQSSRRRRRSVSSSSRSSYSSQSSRSPSPEKKPATGGKKAEVPEPKNKEIVFDSVNLLHEQDKKVALDDLDQDEFVQKPFNSSKKPDPENTIADPQTTKAKAVQQEDSLLHHGLFGDDEGRMEKWVKKLFNFRQKAGQDVA